MATDRQPGQTKREKVESFLSQAYAMPQAMREWQMEKSQQRSVPKDD